MSATHHDLWVFGYGSLMWRPGFAFEEVGLPWAARHYTLAAVSQEFSGFKRSGTIGALRALVLSRYFDTEFKLGRVPQIRRGLTSTAVREADRPRLRPSRLLVARSSIV